MPGTLFKAVSYVFLCPLCDLFATPFFGCADAQRTLPAFNYKILLPELLPSIDLWGGYPLPNHGLHDHGIQCPHPLLSSAGAA